MIHEVCPACANPEKDKEGYCTKCGVYVGKPKKINPSKHGNFFAILNSICFAIIVQLYFVIKTMGEEKWVLKYSLLASVIDHIMITSIFFMVIGLIWKKK